MIDTDTRTRLATDDRALYRRLRHVQARLSAEEAARSNLVAYLAHASYLLLCERWDGTPLARPMRFAVVDETIFLRASATAKDPELIRRHRRVRVAACTIRGLPIADNIECTARVLSRERQADARAALARRCSPARRLLDRLARKSYAYLELTPVDRPPRHPEDPTPAPVIPLHTARRRTRLPRGAA